MSEGFTIEFDQDEFRKRVDNFLGHEFIEFFQNPPDDVMYDIYEFLAKLFEPYTPVDTGALLESVMVTSDGIVYDISPDYAHYVYEGIVYGPNIPVFDKEGNGIRWVSPRGMKKFPTGNYMEYQNPLATRHWDETAIEDNRELVEQTVRDIIINAWKNR